MLLSESRNSTWNEYRNTLYSLHSTQAEPERGKLEKKRYFLLAYLIWERSKRTGNYKLTQASISNSIKDKKGIKGLNIHSSLENLISSARDPEYQGNENQTRLAKNAGFSHLGSLYSYLSTLGFVEMLGYRRINGSVKKVEKLLDLLKNPDDYRGNHNQVRLARDVGFSNLEYLYSALSAFGLSNKLGYNQMNAPVKTVEKLLELLRNPDDYKGNHNQVRLAKNAGFSNLGNFFSVLSALGFAEQLGYKSINAPVKKVEKLLEVLKNSDKYRGNHNQIRLALDSDFSNLGHLYSALSALGFVDKLEYTQMNAPIVKVKKLLEILRNPEEYIGNHNQIRLAKKAGFTHLGFLYGVLSSLDFVSRLRYNRIEASIKTVERLLNLLGTPEKYIGNHNQSILAKDAGFSDLGSLYSALSALGFVNTLGYVLIDANLKNIKKLEELLKEPEKYRGNSNQVRLAKDAGFFHLGHLFSALSALGFVPTLGYNRINASVKSSEELAHELPSAFLIQKKYKVSFISLLKTGKTQRELLESFFTEVCDIRLTDVSEKRLFRYVVSHLDTSNMEYLLSLFKDHERQLDEISGILDRGDEELLSDLEKILLRTLQNNVGRAKVSADAFRKIIQYDVSSMDIPEFPHISETEIFKEVHRSELTEILLRKLPKKFHQELKDVFSGKNDQFSEEILELIKNDTEILDTLAEFL